MGLLRFFQSSSIPKGKYTISHQEIKKLLMTTCNPKNLFLLDAVYRLPSFDEVEKFLSDDNTDKGKYVKEYYDCDDFAFRLMGQFSSKEWSDLSFGLAYSRKHAFNIFVDDSKYVYVIEPMTDEIYHFANIKKGKFKPIHFIIM